MPAYFFVFITIAQLIIIVGHYIVYKAAVVLFVVQSQHTLWILRYCIALLSICFLPVTIYTRYQNNILSRTLYRLAASWMGIFVYAFQASIMILLLYSVHIFFDTLYEWKIYSYVILSIAIILIIYGLINAHLIRTKRVSITLKNLPEYWKGKSFIFLSDTHFGQVRSDNFARRLVKKINTLQPEFILHGGDFFDGVDIDFKSVSTIFSKIKTRHGIYFATGNHESFEDDSSKYTDPLEASGIHVLKNTSVDIEGLVITGAEYITTEKSEDFKKMLGTIQVDTLKPSILIKHVPSSVDIAEQAGISLMLSGHTHRGQLWPFRYITHKTFKKFDYGLRHTGNTQVYTSSGAGTWGPPMRVFTQCEIVYITFQ